MSRKAPRGEYIETDTGNKVSRRSQIIGTQNIILGGKSIIQAEVIIRGDLVRTIEPSSSSSAGADDAGVRKPSAPVVAVAIGRYCFLSKGCVLKPPGRVMKGIFSYHPLKLSDHVFIGRSSIVEAAMVGSRVHIGADCVIGKFAIIKDCVRVLDGTVVPPGMVVPSFSIVAGRPARVVGELPEGAEEGLEGRELYRSVGN